MADLRAAITGTLAVVLVATTSAHAQGGGRVQRPYRGLFGGGAPAGSGHTVTVNASVGGGYDDNILLDRGAGTGIGGNPSTGIAGTLGSMSAGLSYNANLGRFNLGANIGSSTRYYPSQDRTFLSGHNAGLGLRTQITPRTSFGLTQGVSYMPFSFTSVLPPVPGEPALGQIEMPPLDIVSLRRELFTYATSADLQRSFTRRLSGNISYGYVGRTSALYDQPFSQQNGRAGIRFNLGQGLDLTAGYRRSEGRYGGGSGSNASQDNIDAGINYNRALSFSRRTSVSFSTGSAAVKTESRTRFRLTGAASLNHEVGRTWLATLAYNRNVGFVETLLQPVFQDSASAGFGGLVNRRVQVQSSIRASLGQVGMTRRNNQFDTYLAGVGASVAITQHLNFGVNYSLFHYSFGADTVLPLGVPREINRQSVRATLSVWAPLLSTQRRGNATR